MKSILSGITVCSIIFLAACTAPTPQPTATLVFPTIPQPPTETLAATAGEGQTPEPIVTEDIPKGLVLNTFPATVNVQVINLRSGPGTGFDVLGKYAQDAPVAVLGKALGDEWLLVETPAGQLGWMTYEFLAIETPLEALPVINSAYNILVKGTVTDSSGTPVDLVTVAVYQQTVSGELRSDDITNAAGEFFVFLPNGAQGKFSVAIVGVDCNSSIMDADCEYEGKFDANGIAEITLPSSDTVSFVYRP